ncbi:exodeoxyribonuclease V subunit gamma [[Haemophilus] ducreyi]|uniref:exodeoxyribonuclease V subunit gamma n=1 Tax=Haemophilus ducreyi TaxID=730 RepID=UPI000655FBC7|nr:exodeoxyribonuclease V subunit gamma [[Haemophilus] ducreyi]AKO46236.1 exodeoxyribonuclease V subunit gamma [[Haemophilus] ducreyi]AKO47579.1 exodeoxyribonuclease V subunit gamma [[Haemophilus] ducreyi]AKO48961.1 exodeoxyribonuclease V subunit gamma [[Haemophilus] ducreyi]ANF61854.1 exodeoxyribonuclease V subunit gamma [[Haemophilus] ducreyi]ANF68246.1 exodeoxyribonuclease V subunit gamma [[Haemophilus] ducreyi]
MFTVYFSQKLSSLAKLCIQLQQSNPNPNPFEAEIVLVQSVGMAQWLQMQIANQIGIAGNYEFPFPTSFLWQQYRVLFPELPTENIFERETVTWRLIRLIPYYLTLPEFQSLQYYLTKDSRQYQLKLYQLAKKVADLFDQYLVYRPHWLVHWENDRLEIVRDEILNHANLKVKNSEDIWQNLSWQAILWRALINDIKLDCDESVFVTSHRAYLQEQYFNKLDNLTEIEKSKLPKRVFIFGISSLPATQLAVLKKLSEHCQIHLFFLNPSAEYWGDNVEDRVLEKLALKQKMTAKELEALFVQKNNQLLSMWGKQGRDFLAQIIEQEPDQIFDVFDAYEGDSNLIKLKNAILSFDNPQQLLLASQDDSVQFHSCHSIMREVEVLHNRLLQMFAQDPTLAAKDIIVMSADINQYASYIEAVFSRYMKEDKRYIPFAFADQKVITVDPILMSFMSLLNLKESSFDAESLLDLLDVNAIRERFQFQLQDIHIVRHWVNQAGIRFGLTIDQSEWQNYNAWQNGLTRLLMGISLREENGIWQDSVAFNESYGLSAELVGYLANFIEKLSAWHQIIQQKQPIEVWQKQLSLLINDFYQENEESVHAINLLNLALAEIIQKITDAKFEQQIDIEIISLLFNEKLNSQQNNLNFLVGKVNFCTLLPMRAIPFKVVCLLGMNESDFPRAQTVNSFDLMQYASKKGDRAWRDDDRYLFLEALLSAQQFFYISYIGQSNINNKQHLPSVMVSQLLDYFAEYLAPQSLALVSPQGKFSEQHFFAEMVQQHPLTVFSLNNFSETNYAYDLEWLTMTQTEKMQEFCPGEFNSNAELPTEIQLEQLIKFVVNPVQYFFNQHLGIYFRDNNKQIEESEKFVLNALDRYKLRDKLVCLDDDLIQQMFEQEKLKGNLPAANFAQLAQQKIVASVNIIKDELVGYLTESEILEVDQTFLINGIELRVVGNICHRFGDEIVFWKVSGLKDKDYIRYWLYYLFLRIQSQPLKLKVIYLDENKKKVFQFNEISQDDAEKQLRIYLTDYLSNFSCLKWAMFEGLDDYFKNLNKAENIEHYCQENLEKLIGKEFFNSRYLKRILNQSVMLDYGSIHSTTLQWFELMQTSKKSPHSKENE